VSFFVGCAQCEAKSPAVDSTEECRKHGWFIRTLQTGSQFITDFLCPAHKPGA
jgi:hypothetical protein